MRALPPLSSASRSRFLPVAILAAFPCSALFASGAHAQSTLQVLLPTPPNSSSEDFGSDVCTLADVNGDGVDDFAVVTLRKVYADPCVRVFSGADRSILFSIDLGSIPATDRICIADGGDMDGDGVSELVVGQRDYPSELQRDGLVRIFSLRTGEVVRSHYGANLIHLGGAVAGVGDVNGDGFADYAAGAKFGGLLQSGAVTTYSGANGSTLHTQLNPLFSEDKSIGECVAAVGDVNGDGRVDMVTGGRHMALVYTPATGELIRQLNFPLGMTVEACLGAGDLNGDGLDDVVMGAPYRDKSYPTLPTFIPQAGYLFAVGSLASTDLDILWTEYGTYADARIGQDLAHLVVQGLNRVVVAGERHAALRNGSTGAVLHTWDPYSDLAPGFLGRVRVDVIGDVNGDGRRDVLTGAGDATLTSSASVGRVDLYSGVTSYTLFDRLESRTGRNFGAAVALIEDVDGDGKPETVVSAPHQDVGGVYGGGTVRLRSSATGNDLWIHAGKAGEQAGFALLALPDLDGDGISEVAVGTPRSDHGNQGGPLRCGSVNVLSGASGNLLYEVNGNSSGELYGSALANVGDVDGDGVGDFAVGAPGHKIAGTPGVARGRFETRSGATGADLGELHPSLHGGRSGTALAGLGDVNGNGIPDLAVGAPGLDRVRVVELPTGPVLWTETDSAGFGFGSSVTGLGDVDGDGASELAVGAPLATAFGNPVGRVRVLSGADGTLLSQLFGSISGERFGASLADVGDVDENGIPDVAVGAPGAWNGLTVQAGRVEVFRGWGSTTPVRGWSGTTSGVHLGASLAGGLDVDGDGLLDLATGAPGLSDGLGMAQVLGVRASYTTPYGSGTDGCDGAHLLVAGMPAELGTLLELRGTNAAPGAIVFGLYSLGQDVPGTDWGLGFLLHVSLFQHFLTLNGVADGAGRVTFPLPLPDAPGLSGAKLHTQAVFSFAGAPCGQLPQLLSSSHGLSVTLFD